MYRDPYEVRAAIRRSAYILQGSPPLLPGIRGVITGALNKLMTDDATRKIVLAWLFSYNGSGDNPTEEFVPVSSQSLSDGQWLALNQWAEPYKDEEDGSWKTSPQFQAEVLSVARVAVPMFYNVNSLAYDDILDVPPFVAELKMMGGKITNIEDDDEERSGR